DVTMVFVHCRNHPSDEQQPRERASNRDKYSQPSKPERRRCARGQVVAEVSARVKQPCRQDRQTPELECLVEWNHFHRRTSSVILMVAKQPEDRFLRLCIVHLTQCKVNLTKRQA